ncbi:MAG: Hvo_1808 family surface protein [Thermomicrobiales bacterium]
MPLPKPCSLLRFAVPALVAFSISLSPGLAAQSSVFTDIEDRTQQIRQLDLLEPLDLTFITRDEMRAEIASDDYPLEEQQRDLRVLVAFGLVPPDTDLGALYNDLYGEGVLGYYDPNTKRMVVVSDSGEGTTELSASEELTFAHETVHALQDQHFDLVALQNRAGAANADASLALIALPEGDATYFESLYATSDRDFLKRLLDEYQNMELPDVLESAPAIFIDTLYFPYDQGGSFVSAIYENGGWDAVDDLYANPPVSTEQILHPDKYVSGEMPIEVQVSDPSAALGDGWTVLDDDTFGEFQISILLDTSDDISDDEAADAAAGWSGDRYVVVGNENDTAIYWDTVWDSEDDANEFAHTLIEREADRLGASTTSLESGTGTAIVKDDETVHVVVDGMHVTYVSAPDEQTLNTVVAGATSPEGTPVATPVAIKD